MDKFNKLVKFEKYTCITMGMQIPDGYLSPKEWGDAERIVVALLVSGDNDWVFSNYSIETQNAATFLAYLSENAYGSGFRHGVDFLQKVEAKGQLHYAISPTSFVDAIDQLTNKVNGE